MVNVRLLEVSLYARGPRKGDVCRDVAFHEEMPKILSRYTWNNKNTISSLVDRPYFLCRHSSGKVFGTSKWTTQAPDEHTHKKCSL